MNAKLFFSENKLVLNNEILLLSAMRFHLHSTTGCTIFKLSPSYCINLTALTALYLTFRKVQALLHTRD